MNETLLFLKDYFETVGTGVCVIIFRFRQRVDYLLVLFALLGKLRNGKHPRERRCSSSPRGRREYPLTPGRAIIVPERRKWTAIDEQHAIRSFPSSLYCVYSKTFLFLLHTRKRRSHYRHVKTLHVLLYFRGMHAKRSELMALLMKRKKWAGSLDETLPAATWERRPFCLHNHSTCFFLSTTEEAFVSWKEYQSTSFLPFS